MSLSVRLKSVIIYVLKKNLTNVVIFIEDSEGGGCEN